MPQHISPAFALKCWKKIRSNNTTGAEGANPLQVLSVLGYVSPGLGQKRQDVALDVVDQLSSYDVEPMKIQAYVQVLVRLCENKKELIKEWAMKLFESCHEVFFFFPC